MDPIVPSKLEIERDIEVFDKKVIDTTNLPYAPSALAS